MLSQKGTRIALMAANLVFDTRFRKIVTVVTLHINTLRDIIRNNKLLAPKLQQASPSLLSGNLPMPYLLGLTFD